MRFWEMTNGQRSRSMYPSPDCDYQENYPRYIAFRKGETRLDVPLVFYTASEGVAYDFLETTMFLQLVSPRLAQAIESGGFTGVQLTPGVIHLINGAVLEGYKALSVTGRCGPLRPLQEAPEGRIREGLAVQEDQWDGSDFSLPDGSNAFMFVTDRVREALKPLNATNLRFFPPEKILY